MESFLQIDFQKVKLAAWGKHTTGSRKGGNFRAHQRQKRGLSRHHGRKGQWMRRREGKHVHVQKDVVPPSRPARSRGKRIPGAETPSVKILVRTLAVRKGATCRIQKLAPKAADSYPSSEGRDRITKWGKDGPTTIQIKRKEHARMTQAKEKPISVG